jgi:glycopeptide antibiotics resistance protein
MMMRSVQNGCDGLFFSRYKTWILAVYTFGMLLTSIIPMSRQKSGAPFWAALDPSAQNMLHVPMFMIFVFLLSRVMADGTSRIFMQWFAVLGASTLFGIILEGVQSVIPGRYPSFADVLLNVLGAGLGFMILIALRHGRKKNAGPKDIVL